MLSLCRLCAVCTDPIELITEISELEPKLVHCFGWRKSEKEIEMPKKACNICVDRLQMSYDFVECLLTAEKQLNKLLSEQIQTSTDEFISPTVEIKGEDERKRLVDAPVPVDSEKLGRCLVDDDDSDDEKNIYENRNNDVIEFDDDTKHEDDSDDAIFGEPIETECSNKNSTKKVSKKHKKKRQPASDAFLDALDAEDRLDSGLISTNGVKKLEKLFPDMKTVSWDDCQYKCENCDRIFKGSTEFYSHIRSIHIEEVLSIVVPCFYCDSKHRREYTLNRHMATEHFIHLKHR